MRRRKRDVNPKCSALSFQDPRHLIRILIFEFLYVLANCVVEYGYYLSPAAFYDTRVLVNQYVELHDCGSGVRSRRPPGTASEAATVHIQDGF